METRVSAKHLCASSILARASMSAEHGHGHGGENVNDIVAALFMCCIAYPLILDKTTEALEEVAGYGGGHGGGHGH